MTACLRLIRADGTTDGDSAAILGPYLTLPEFFEFWYRPVILETAGRSTRTVAEYRVSLRWWRRIVGDVPLSGVSEYSIAEFVAGLREATYQRGMSGDCRTLGQWTAAKHLRAVRAVLIRTGPSTDSRRACKGLVPTIPPVPSTRPISHVKSSLSIEQARSVVATAATWSRPQALEAPGRWWSALLCTLALGGLRIGTAAALRWEWITENVAGEFWWRIPAEATKTKRPLERLAHPCVVAALRALGWRTAGLVFAPPVTWRHLAGEHGRLLTAAGVRGVSGWHAWRRSFAWWIAERGGGAGLEAARSLLGHSSASVTAGHYVSAAALEAVSVAALPWLFSQEGQVL